MPTDCSSSASVWFLLMMSRMRWVPASGASVMLPFFCAAIRRATSTGTLSGRVEGSEICTRVGHSSSASAFTCSTIWVWSVVESEISEISSMPVAWSPLSTSSTICWAGFSRTGRLIIPAWQKRQPRVQPRMISTESRSWVISPTGTSGIAG